MGFVSPHADLSFLPLYDSPPPPADDVAVNRLQHLTLDVDRLLGQYTEKVRVEVAERVRQRLLLAVESGTAKRLEAKEEEIARVRKSNCELGERAKSLYADNQMWREVARSNQAAARALRTGLAQVLVAVAWERVDQLRAAAAESCCSGEVKCEEEEGEDELGGAEWRRRRCCCCCRAREATVLLLPCRHLCLCAACTPTATACPVCNCCKNGSVTVNFC